VNDTEINMVRDCDIIVTMISVTPLPSTTILGEVCLGRIFGEKYKYSF